METQGIRKVAFVGIGALGTLFGDLMVTALGREAVDFVVDPARLERYRAQGGFTCNGRACDFNLVAVDDVREPYDLVVIGVKYPMLAQTARDYARLVGPGTTIISMLNGVVAEEDLARSFDASQVIPCIARGMDAVRVGLGTTYSKVGELAIGIGRINGSGPYLGDEARLAELDAFLTRAGVPHSVVDDIAHDKWSKLVCNVGINQACMVNEATYGQVRNDPTRRAQMIEAMRETVAVARAEGIGLDESDVTFWVNVIDNLGADLMPSMRQDGAAHRPSEVALFGETICRLGRAHGIPTPRNDEWVDAIHAMEAAY